MLRQQKSQHGCMHFSMVTGVVCVLVGLFLLMRTMQREQRHYEVNRNAAVELKPQEQDPAVAHHGDGDSDELDRQDEPIRNTDTTMENSPQAGDRAGDLARLFAYMGCPDHSNDIHLSICSFG